MNKPDWYKVNPGEQLTKKYKKISNISVRFGGGTMKNALLPSCHNIFPSYGMKDTASASPSSQNHFTVFDGSGPVRARIVFSPLGNVSFTLVKVGSFYCSGVNADCMVYDCSIY